VGVAVPVGEGVADSVGASERTSVAGGAEEEGMAVCVEAHAVSIDRMRASKQRTLLM
jgi:hypothetical protein